MSHSLIRLARTLPVLLAVATGAIAATPAVAKPPWISIELPANPYDRASQGAFLLVHTFDHTREVAFPVTGSAEGLVGGQRRTVPLRFESTSRPGVFALRKQWPGEGVWTLLITVKKAEDQWGQAQAVVELDAAGQVASVRVPTRDERGFAVPTKVGMREVEQGLRARAALVAAR